MRAPAAAVYGGLIPGYAAIHVHGPSIDSSGEVFDIQETAPQKILTGSRRSASMVALNHQRLLGVGELLAHDRRPQGERKKLGTRDIGDAPLIFFAHIDQTRRRIGLQ